MIQQNPHVTFDEKGKRHFEIIEQAAKRMSLLIDDLLKYSRAGRVALNKKRVSLDWLIGEVLQELNVDVQGREIEWHIQKLPEVEVDELLMKTVLTNLLSNAIKYTRDRQKAIIFVSLEEREKEYVFKIHDNGVGFDEKYAHKLFKVFQHLHGDGYEGTGIGLANVKRLVARHGGAVWAEGKVGEGAIFYFSLPK